VSYSRGGATGESLLVRHLSDEVATVAVSDVTSGFLRAGRGEEATAGACKRCRFLSLFNARQPASRAAAAAADAVAID